MTPLLSVKDLTKTFKRPGMPPLTAVDHVSFDLYEGECLGMIGESGSGKSTVAGMLTRLTKPDSGSIFLEGDDITSAKGKQLKEVYRKVQMVFQQPEVSFDPRQRIGDGIAESLRNRGVSRAEAGKKAREAMTACGLDPELYERYPHALSGGQCQRAAIARALIGSPKILICDEATSSLDVTIQKEIMELLAEMVKKDHLACIFICHDIALVREFCSRVLVMYGGRIVEGGTPEDVIMHPKADYTKQLINGRELRCLKQ